MKKISFAERPLSLLFLAVFAESSTPFFEKLLFFVTKAPLSRWATTVYQVFAFAVFWFLLVVYLSGKERPKKAALRTALGTLPCAGVLYILSQYLFSALYNNASLALLKNAFTTGSVAGYAIFSFVALLLLVMCVIYLYVFARVAAENSIGLLEGNNQAFAQAFRAFFKKIPTSLLLSVGYLAYGVVGWLLTQRLSSLERAILSGDVISSILLYSAICLLGTFALAFCFSMVDGYDLTLAAEKKKAVPFAGIALLAVVVGLYFLSGYSLNRGIDTQIEMSIDAHSTYGKTESEMGASYTALTEYNAALGELSAYRGYLLAIANAKGGNPDQTVMESLFKKAHEYDTNNSLIYLLHAQARLVSGSTATVGDLMKEANAITAKSDMNYLVLLQWLKAAGREDTDEFRNHLQYCANRGLYYDDTLSLQKWSQNKINKKLLELDKLELAIRPGYYVAKAFCEKDLGDFQTAIKTLTEYAKEFPNDVNAQYYLSSFAASYSHERGSYPIAKEAVLAFDKLYEAASPEEQVEKAIYVADVLIETQSYNETNSYLAPCYKDSEELTLRYAYAYFNKGDTEKAKSLLSGMGGTDAAYLRARCLLAERDYEASLGEMNKLNDALLAAEDAALRNHLDETVAHYAEAFTNSKIGLEAFQELTERTTVKPIIRGYIFARYYWAQKEDALLENAVSKLLKECPALSHAYYYRGFREYEREEYTAAIRDLKQAIAIDPNNHEATFALGFAYYLNGDEELSARAFSRVHQFYPVVNHEDDPYGLAHHSLNELSGLTDAIGKLEGN